MLDTGAKTADILFAVFAFWMTKDAFWAAVLGIGIIVLFVGYNASRSFKRRYTVVKRPDNNE